MNKLEILQNNSIRFYNINNSQDIKLRLHNKSLV